jgi:hypothetical protein
MHKLYVDECVKFAEEPISLRAFSDIFTKEFNFHFRHLSLDTNKFCDKWVMKIEAASTSHESSKLRAECELHHWKAQLAHNTMKEDFGNGFVVIALDPQQALQLLT